MGLAQSKEAAHSQELAPLVLDLIAEMVVFPWLCVLHGAGGEGPPSCPAATQRQCPRKCGQSWALPQAGGRCLQLEDNHCLAAKMCN